MKRTSLKPANPERRAKQYARNYGERAAAIRSMGCVVAQRRARRGGPDLGTACAGRIVAAHVRARGMGGVKGDRRTLAPMCFRHHEQAGEYRTTQRAEFERRHGVDLLTIAAEIASKLDEAGYP